MLAALVVLLQQTSDTTRRDSLPAIVVQGYIRLPLVAVHSERRVVDESRLPGRRYTGLDELVEDISGVYDANRYNYSLDQRLSIRGFGARSSFGVRGVKVFLDDIPQTLPDGTGQLSNVEFGAVHTVSVTRGPSSALYGNASGGVINLESVDTAHAFREAVRAEGGSYDSKVTSTTDVPVGAGLATLVASRFRYSGFRQHSAAEFRNFNGRYLVPLGRAQLALTADYAADPRADNPGALTAAELAANRDSAAAINIRRNAGKDVGQFQGGVSLRLPGRRGDLLSVAGFVFSRHLVNPQTFAWIGLDRLDYGTRIVYRRGWRPLEVTVGLDAQRQRDSRLNVGNPNGSPDTVRQLDQLEHVTEVGPFSQLTLAAGPLSLVGGVRYDVVDFAVDDRLVTPTNPDDSGRRSMHAPSGSLGVEWHAAAPLWIWANAGTSFETPTTTELTNRPDTAGGFNPTLQPQRAQGFEVGIRGHIGYRVNGSVDVFSLGVRDELIAYAIPASPGRVFYQNAGRTRHQGLEADVDAQPISRLLLHASVTLSDFRYASYSTAGHVLDGRPIPGVPQRWIHLRATWTPREDRGPFVELDDAISSSVLVDDTLDRRAEGWNSVDVRAGWTGPGGGFHVLPFVAVNNVFDRHYVGSVVINAAAGRYFEPAPGRNVFVGAAVHWN